jgi:hypothetical protein
MSSEETASFKESFDTKMNTVNQNVKELKTELTQHAKMQTLAWAIANCDLNSFYYDEPGVSLCSSQDLVRSILFTFRQGFGYYLSDKARLAPKETFSMREESEEQKRKSEQDFRDNVSNQIHQLTGTKPLISKEEEGYLIYYPK